MSTPERGEGALGPSGSPTRLEQLQQQAAELTPELKAFARQLEIMTGVDFTRLDQRQLADRFSSLITVWEHAIPFGIGVLSGLALALLVWWSPVSGMQGGPMSSLLLLLAVLSGLTAGAIFGALLVAWRIFRLLDDIIVLGVNASQEVTAELRRVSPSALAKVPTLELVRGGIWLAGLPAMNVVLRRRLKLPPLQALASGVLRRGMRLVLPPPSEKHIAELRERQGDAAPVLPTREEDASSTERVAEPKSERLQKIETTLRRRTRWLGRVVLIPLGVLTGLWALIVIGGGLIAAALLG